MALVLLVIVSVLSHAYADDVSLPLAGYFHSGRAMPVKWDVSASGSAGGDLQIFASDAVTTHLKLSDQRHGIMPWIAVDSNVRRLRWQSTSGSAGEIAGLHPLDDSDFLVGTTANDADLGLLFPNRPIILVHLDADDLRSPAMAWETLDALILTRDEWQKLSVGLPESLFAEGITLAMKGEAHPDVRLPWRRLGQWWVAAAQLKLPPMVDAEAYAPTDGWIPGRSAEFRRRIFLFGAIYCLIACGIYLWRSRWMPAGFVAVSIIVGTAIAFQNAHQSPVAEQRGTILVKEDVNFTDDWLYQISHRPADFRVPVEALVQPIFEEASQVEETNLKLDCDADGNPIAISGHLAADQPLALMSRKIAGENAADFAMGSPSSPLIRLRPSLYRQFIVAGQLSNSAGENVWPTVVFSWR